LFFVSKNDNTHFFSTNYDDHRKAVRKYQLNK
jgi:cell division protein YceG involved in septum cleavage